MAFGQPQDPEIPDYHPFLMQAAGMQGGVPQVQQPQQQAQVAVPAQAAPQMTAVPQAPPQQAPQAAAAPAAPADPSQQPAVALPSVPQAPTLDEQRYQQLSDAVSKYGKPIDRKDPAVAPKWYERLAGAAVGFGTGYGSGAEAGIRAGSAVVNRRYDHAAEDQATNEASAKTDLANFRDKYDLDTKGYENAARGFGMGMEKANAQQGQQNADRTFKAGRDDASRQQANADRNFGREVADDAWKHKNGDDELAQKGKYQDGLLGNEGKRLAEEGRHNRAEEGLGYARLKDDRDDRADSKSNAAKGDDLKRQIAKNTLNSQRQNQLDQLERGNPKDPNDDGGFQGALAKIDRNKQLTTEQKEAQKAQLSAQHAEAKNRVEDVYAQGMGELGENVQAVRYDAQGRVQKQSNGQPQQPQQVAAPVPATAPKSQTEPAAAPVQQGQQQQQQPARQTRQVKDAKGNTIDVYPENGRWINAKTGKPL